MRSSLLALCCFGLLPLAGPALAQEPLQSETVTTEVIPPGTQKLFIADIAIGHIVDGRLFVLDATSLKRLGTIGIGFTGQVYVPGGGDSVYVSTSYIEKISRGKRTDFLEVYDSSTLQLTKEIAIASSRAQALNYRPMLQGSSDGRWMLVQNATPATSVSIVDVPAGKQTAEVPNAGCYGTYPSSKDPLLFATMCGDGTFGSYRLAGDGTSAERKASDRLFDSDTDALFIHGERDGDTWLFVSFAGNIYRVDIEGETAKLVEKLPLGVDGWRPSGYQTHAYHPSSGVLFVLMHPNGAEGSHKNPAEEIWAYDVKGKKLLSRSPTTTAFSITVGRSEGAPVVYAINLVNAKALRYTSDPAKDYALTPAGEGPAGEAPIQIEAQ